MLILSNQNSANRAVGAWPGLNDLSLRHHRSPHIAAWDYSTRLCFKFHWESNSCFLPSDFFTNVHIRPLSEIPSAVLNCPSIEFYQQYHLSCSATFTEDLYANRFQDPTHPSDWLREEIDRSMRDQSQFGSHYSEAPLPPRPLSSSSYGQSSVCARNQQLTVSDNFLQEMRIFISMIDSALKANYRCPIYLLDH